MSDSGITIGEAWLQIRPSTRGMTDELEEAMGSAGSRSGGIFASTFSTGLKALSGVAIASLGAAATGVGFLTRESVAAYSQFEQLVGGVETLFGESSDEVQRNAEMAFRTAGLSANEYMETVTSFSASLLQSTAGDTQLAADIADMAIRDMSDNANKMGTSMEAIQNAYQGFAKDNYTMLDNLKLGYGGTRSEMERLLADATELTGIEYNIENLSDVYEAIHVIQENIGIAGTTAAEAEGTIAGSAASIGAAWKNLVAGFANPDADLGVLIDNLVKTGATALDNLIPTVLNALSGITDAIPMIIPVITQNIPLLVQQLLPLLVQAVKSLLEGLVAALPELINVIVAILPDMFMMLVDTILTLLPTLIDLALDLVLALADGITQALPELIPAVVDVILTIVDKLTDPDMLVQLIDAALKLIIALAEGLIKALPRLVEKAPEIIKNLLSALIQAAPMILEAGMELIFQLIEGVLMVIGQLVTIGSDLVNSVKDGFMEKVEAAKTWGKDMIDNFISGIKEKWEKLKSTVTDLANTIKSLLGFSEPEAGPLANFHTFAPDMMELFSQGIRDNLGLVTNAIGMVTNSIADDFTSPDLVPISYSPIANPTEQLQSVLGANNEGDMIIPIYIGQEKLDTIILNAQQRHALVSGGR